MTLVRLITRKSLILARLVRMSSWMPSAKNAFSLSSLKFSNGSTAMPFASICVSIGRRSSRSRRRKRPSPIATIAIREPKISGFLRFALALNLGRNLRIAEILSRKIYQTDPHPMLDHRLAQLMQMRTPAFVIFQILGHAFAQQDVTSITAIHHPLRNVNSRTRDIGSLVYIGHFIHQAAVNSHSNLKLRMAFKRLRNFQRALCRSFRTLAKNQRHAVAGRQSQECACAVRRAKLLGPPHDLVQLAQNFALLVMK